MATADLQPYIEDRLRALDPTIDLDPGSPAQVQFIAPLLARLGTDPLETNIDAFLTDRFSQEFPDIYANDPSVVRDTFVKPLILFLEPFKREIQTIKNNQSFKNATLMSDEDADSLAANVFDTRDSGGFSVGVGRIFFAQPSNQQVDLTTRFFTSGGLSFFPTSTIGITAEQMVFQKSGNLFFMDVPLKAESEGAEYDIDPGELSGVEGVFGALRVTNIREFADGSAKLDTPTFLANAEQSLTERSLVTRRGASARLRADFQTDVRAVQVIGSKDPEMQRDILVAASPGHAWLTGKVSLNDKLAFVQVRTVEGSIDDIPVAGDTLYVYLDKYSYTATWAGLDEAARFLRFTIEEVLTTRMEEIAPFRCAYLIRWSGAPPTGIVLPNPAVLEGGFSKKGTVRISSLADIGPVSLSVPNDAVHVYGHTDVYVRPVLQKVSKAVITSLNDEESFVERTTLQTGAASNAVVDLAFDFAASGVVAGDVLVIESGNDAGTYIIRGVAPNLPGTLRISANLSTSDVTNTIRYRIIRTIGINPFEPKVPKFPFGALPANDLTTTIGSNLGVLSTDIINFGAAVGDVFRVLSGSDVGDFTITAFDAVLGGMGIIVDRPFAASNPNVEYQVFTALESVQLPLVRIKQLLLLDSAKQSTGITIPPAEPVAVVPTGTLSSARVRATSHGFSGYVLPDFTGFVVGGNVAAPSGDRRYSLGFDPVSGTYRWVLFADGTSAEFDFRADANGACTYFLATSEDTGAGVNYPPIDPRPGECLTLKNGPNKGSYLIKDVIKFKHRLASPTRDVWSYFIKIYGTFPVDVFKQLVTFLDTAETAGAVGAGVTKITGVGSVAFPTFFSTTVAGLGAKLHTALTFYGTSSPGAAILQASIDELTEVQYEWGDPARGVLRSYFTEPTLFEQHTADHTVPTSYRFKSTSGDFIHFRPDPSRYTKQEIVPARLTADADPMNYPRDGDFSAPPVWNFTDAARPSLFNLGVAPGDVLAVNEEIFFHGVTKMRQAAVQTAQGSTIVTAPTTAGNIFTREMEGNLLSIEESEDTGMYRVVSFIDGRNISLDRPLTKTTMSILAQGAVGSYGLSAGDNLITDVGAAFNFTPYIGKYITIFGIDYNYAGSYEITAATPLGTCEVTKTPDFPAFAAAVGAHFVLTEAPVTPPDDNATGNGKEMIALRPVRMYDGIPKEDTIISVSPYPDASNMDTTVITFRDGFKQPFRIYRKNIRRLTPTEIAAQKDGSLFFFDTEVVSLEPQVAANLPEQSYLVPLEGTYLSFGYRHVVGDPSLTYSMLEAGEIEFPTSILPLDSEDSTENFISLVGTPIEVSYERADIVQKFHEFLNSALDRVTSANMLARHFLPSYVSYDAFYTGGSAPSVVAADIYKYIDTLVVEQPVDVSEIEKLIEQRGGNPTTPTKVVIVLHDWDRKVWAEFSENEIGGIETLVPYNGTPRVSYCTPGPDVSGQDPLPAGERINLTRR